MMSRLSTLTSETFPLSKRLGAAAAEMEYGEAEGNFDIIIVNDDLEAAYVKLREFVIPEMEKLYSARNQNLPEKFDKM